MPNHVTTKIIGPHEMTDYLLDAKGQVDFNKLIPQPKNIENGMCVHQPWDLDENLADEDGMVCWYAWNNRNWGTKWNAYNTEVKVHPGEITEGATEIQFETAWGHPMPILEALSEEISDSGLIVEYADEDFGYNLGSYIIVRGDIVNEREFEEGSLVAKDFATDLKYGMSYKEWCDSWDD